MSNNRTVSIVIPCRNEEKYIEKCITSLLNSNYPKELVTIMVCDGMSTDNTRAIISQLSKINTNVVLIDNVKQTTPFALNLGLKKATADIKIILGAHSEVDPNFISENIKVLKISDEIGCSGGVLENVYENETSEIIGLAMSSSFGVGNAHFRTGNKNGYVDTVAFGAYKKEVFEDVGYFDESLTRNQDDEFNYRLIKHNYKIYLSQKIKCKYYVRGSFDKLFKQYYQYGYWKVFVNKKHKTVTTVRQLIPLFFVLFLSVGAITSMLHNLIFYAYLGVIILYVVFAFLSALKLSTKPSYIYKLVYCFLILHCSYGLGYLTGIFSFLLLNNNPSKNSESSSR